MKLVDVNADQIQVFVKRSNVRMKINAGVNVTNQLRKAVVIKDLLGTLITVNVNVIDHVMLQNIQTNQIVSAEKT